MQSPVTVVGIDLGLVDERAIKVVKTLTDAGHEAYIVGGAVRDLLVGRRPKDFDVATDATPEQIKVQYKTLVKRLHPDANGGSRATEDKLKEVIQAYDYLRSVGLC